MQVQHIWPSKGVFCTSFPLIVMYLLFIKVVILQYISLVTFFALLVGILLGKILDYLRTGILVQLQPLQNESFGAWQNPPS